MRVRATALASSESNAVGTVELECTPAGLSIGLFGVGAFQDGYAPGVPTHGTRFCVPYADVTLAHAGGDQLLLQLSTPSFPHNRLTLSRFTAGHGVPPSELRKRRLLLHFGALTIAGLATLAASMLVPGEPTENVAWGALGYGALAALMTLGFGYSLDQHLFLRPAGEAEIREAFIGDLAGFLPALRRSEQALAGPPRMQLPRLSGWVPRTAAGIGVTVAAVVLTALVSGQRLLLRQEHQMQATALRDIQPERVSERGTRAPTAAPSPPSTGPAEVFESEAPAADEPQLDGIVVERRCLCDRADSPLWRKPIPRLSALLLEKRVVPRKSSLRLRVEVAVVNNGDTPLEELTVHVQFFELDKNQRKTHTKERPLYFEGPLHPGQAIKWTAEARGTEFEIQAPDFGLLGVDGQGAAPKDTFAELLTANHRPVRLHAARMLSYLGDPRGRSGALELRDALRAAEGPYLRRVLAATAELRVCDVERAGSGSIGACVFNAGDEPRDDVGLEATSLYGSLDVSHPLAHPPEIAHQKKWKLAGPLDAQAGSFVRVSVPADFFSEGAHSLEVNADRFDRLD